MITLSPPDIRLATADDVHDIHAMLREIATVTGAQDKFQSRPEDILRDGFGQQRAFEAMVGVDDHKAVALCLYFPSYSTFRGKHGIYIQDLYVAPEYRGGQFARKLVAETARRAISNGKVYVRLSVDAGNVIGQKFYERIGMRRADDERIYILDGMALRQLADV